VCGPDIRLMSIYNVTDVGGVVGWGSCFDIKANNGLIVDLNIKRIYERP